MEDSMVRKRTKSAASSGTLLLSRSDVERCLEVSEVVALVERVFEEHTKGEIAMPPKVSLDMSAFGIPSWMNAMPAYDHFIGVHGLKWIGGFADNASTAELPYLMGTLLLNDPRTGMTTAMMDATRITSMRTGASAAVAARHLARSDSAVATVIGCGVQGVDSLRCLHHVFKLEEVRAVDLEQDARRAFLEEAAALGINGRAVEDIREAVADADIIVMATTANEPLVMWDWLNPGAFIADLGSYQELSDEVVMRADKRVVDHRAQAEHRGELARLFRGRRITQEDVYAELGEIVVGTVPGREADAEIIVAALIGMASEDVAVGNAVVQRARTLELGQCFDFLA